MYCLSRDMCDETVRKSGEGGGKGGVYSNWGTGQGWRPDLGEAQWLQRC